MTNIHDIKHIINNPRTLKVLATVDIDGVPYTAVKQTLHVNEDGNVEYVELFESSQSYRNATGSIWYDKKVSIAVYGENKESYTIIGKPQRINIAGREYEKVYTEFLEEKGFDIAAIITIVPEFIVNQSPEENFAEQEKTRPFFRHLDRLKK